jgi:hypothetical protein
LEYFPDAPELPIMGSGGRLLIDAMPCLVIDEERKRAYFDTSDPEWVDEELTQVYQRYLDEDVDFFAIKPEHGRGIYAMLEMLEKGLETKPKLIRFTFLGPFSYGMQLTDEKRKPIFYNETFRDAIVKVLAMKGKWLERRVRQALPGVETMLQLGEPQLALYSSAYTAVTKKDIIDAIRGVTESCSGLSMVHCCANIDWSILLEGDIDAISFNACEHAEYIALYPQELARYLEQGGMLAWGIIPAYDDLIGTETLDGAIDRFESALEHMVRRGIDKGQLVESSFITPTCGTNLMSPELLERACSLTLGLSRAMRARYFGQARGIDIAI